MKTALFAKVIAMLATGAVLASCESETAPPSAQDEGRAAKGEVLARSAQDLIAVFVPTTPNPTSGFLIYAPRDEVTFLDMSVEDAAKLVISAGLVTPPDHLRPGSVDASALRTGTAGR